MKIIRFFSLMTLVASIGFMSCQQGDNSDNNSDYNDDLASPNPVLDFTNINIPNPTFSSESGNIIRIDMAGILHPLIKDWIELVGTSTSTSPTLRASGIDLKAYIYIEVDGTSKCVPNNGVGVINNSESSSTNRSADIVFLVDNSGSMDEEAEGVAQSIKDFADYLTQQKYDVKFGCVGYGYNSDTSIYGAINLTNADSLSNYLDRSYGRDRTVGYSGSDASTLQSLADSYSSYNYGGECGVLAFRFADENFKLSAANTSRVYVNFTDEPNQPCGNAKYSIKYTSDPSKWINQSSIIHTVFSDPDTATVCQRSVGYNWLDGYYERPWLMSDSTGGTTLFTDPSFMTIRSGGAVNVSSSMRASSSGYISLLDLPVTGALVHSYIIRFKNTSTVSDGAHEVKITIQSADKSVQGEKVFKNVTFGSSGSFNGGHKLF